MTSTHSQNSETEDLSEVQFTVSLWLSAAVLLAELSSTHLSVDGKANDQTDYQSSYHVTEMLIRMIIRWFLFSASARHFLVVELI